MLHFGDITKMTVGGPTNGWMTQLQLEVRIKEAFITPQMLWRQQRDKTVFMCVKADFFPTLIVYSLFSSSLLRCFQ
jgi:hypothetical protein